MEPNENVDLIHHAIQRLIEDKKTKKNKEISSDDAYFINHEDDDDDDDQLLLSQLLSQLETLKRDGMRQNHEVPIEEIEVKTGKVKENDIIKELGKLKKQNFITHCLLSVMIVLTVAWQLSEVSLILKVKNHITNPFKSFGNFFSGMMKGPAEMVVNDGHKEMLSPTKQSKSDAPSIPIKIPEMPRMDLSSLGLDNGEE